MKSGVKWQPYKVWIIDLVSSEGSNEDGSTDCGYAPLSTVGMLIGMCRFRFRLHGLARGFDVDLGLTCRRAKGLSRIEFCLAY